MSNFVRTLTIVYHAFGLLIMSASVPGKTMPVRTLEYTFMPVEMPNKAGPVKLELAFKRKQVQSKFQADIYNCDEVEIRIRRILNLDYTGDTAWVVQVDSGKWYKSIIEIDIPPNEVSGIEVMLTCGRGPNPAACYFVTTGDTVEFYRGRPSGHPPTPPRRSLKTFVDTLTEEQLQTNYEVIVELKKSSQRKFVEKFVGSLKDSTLYDPKRKYYKLWITLQNLIKIGEVGIEFDFVTPPPWDKRHRSPIDSTDYKDSTNDSIRRRGTLQVSPPGFSLDWVDGLTSPGVIPSGVPITFNIRLFNSTGFFIEGMQNGFRVYSPDGAQWSSFTADTFAVGLSDTFNSFAIQHFSADGAGADTAGFTAAWDGPHCFTLEKPAGRPQLAVGSYHTITYLTPIHSRILS